MLIMETVGSMTDDQAKILLIEDDARLARTLTQGLQEEGYAVITAANGEDGYFLYNQHDPDIVLLDLNLRAETASTSSRQSAGKTGRRRY